MLDVGTVVGDALISVATILSGYTARKGHTNGKRIRATERKMAQTSDAMEQVQKQTNGMLLSRIETVVTKVLMDQPRYTIEMRDFIDSILNNARRDEIDE